MTWRQGALLIAVTFLMYGPSLAMAQGPGAIVPKDCQTGDPRNCGCAQLVELAQNILNTSIYIAVILSAVLFAWAGFKYLNAGNSGEQAKAKTLLMNVSVGLVLILVAWGIVDTIVKTIAPGKGANWIWNQLQC